ncbi:MAG: OB-fold domain-containing protein [Acetobacteraceae bacterium]|nr:OB-fold domain-containing protein [Acetobacteraceae bacterium]
MRQEKMENAKKSPLGIYNEHLQRGELAYQFSPSVGKPVFYPRIICPYTGSEDLEWRISKGLGTVHATTVVHPAQGEAYNVCLVDMDEGYRLMSRVEDMDPMAVKIGQRVRFRAHHPGGDEAPIPVFTALEG